MLLLLFVGNRRGGQGREGAGVKDTWFITGAPDNHIRELGSEHKRPFEDLEEMTIPTLCEYPHDRMCHFYTLCKNAPMMKISFVAVYTPCTESTAFIMAIKCFFLSKLPHKSSVN